ncbi:MAG: hypothetical protein OXF68_11015, partial [Gammaproteobacteria bacterium]|nr:hypothetical protein [Gammaproteobacteria bacterium]
LSRRLSSKRSQSRSPLRPANTPEAVGALRVPTVFKVVRVERRKQARWPESQQPQGFSAHQKTTMRF